MYVTHNIPFSILHPFVSLTGPVLADVSHTGTSQTGSKIQAELRKGSVLALPNNEQADHRKKYIKQRESLFTSYSRPIGF